ncbi:MAG: acetyl-CoA acetyltransferase [Chloroflexi bacterium]|nr:acetyl-CoA acetyltransferase [Chloroflexota bacterium]MYD17495.1 acetyl-CoA acetyltransferase [Chloroflexota bacterium]
MGKRTMRGETAIIGVGETTYYKRGRSPDAEFKLVIEAILKASADAGIDPREIDGFASYSNDRNDPSRIAAALDIKDLRFSNMEWGGGGGGGSAACAHAAAAVATGLADTVVVFRGLAQGQFGRFGQGAQVPHVRGDQAYTAPYGLMSPAQSFAMRVHRLFDDHGITQDTLKACSLASYHHAQNNPRAVMYGRPLSPEDYDASRWIVEPFHLFDCCQENDGAAAMIFVSADRAKDYAKTPVYFLGGAVGSGNRAGSGSHNATDYATSNFKTVAPRMYDMAEVKPEEVDVAQVYENFTGGVVMSIIEHGLTSYEEANDFITFENLTAPAGKMPINTSGGNLAECYMHGLELNIEAVRQVRGESCNQVPDVNVSLVASGPMVTPVSDMIVGSEAVL